MKTRETRQSLTMTICEPKKKEVEDEGNEFAYARTPVSVINCQQSTQ